MYTQSNVTLMVSDFDRAVRFYTETLGLTLRRRVENAWAEVSGPGLTIGLHPAGDVGPQPGPCDSTSIGLGVENVEAAIAVLRERGIEFAPYHDDGAVRFATFRDPDETSLYLFEVKAQ